LEHRPAPLIWRVNQTGALPVATSKENRKVSIVGAVVVAALLGLVIGAVMFNSPGTPLPPPANVEFTGEYDDSWGRLASPVPRCGVSHILVKIDETRTEAEAKKLIEQIWHQYKNNNGDKKKWRELQEKYNEDTADKFKIYPIPGNWMPEFIQTGKTTEVGFARIAKTSYGYHLIRRES
jgi:hypothetical protein